MSVGPRSVTSFRHSLVPMVVADDTRRYVAVNAAACLLLRLPEAAVIGRTIDELTPVQARAEMDAMWRQFIVEGVQRGTYELQMPDGPRLRVDYSATANVTPGRHLSILMFPAAGEDFPIQPPRTPRRLLTGRERQVLALVAMGHGSDAIAAALHVSSSTVQTHVRHCLEKLGARNRAHAIALGLRAEEIDLDLDEHTG
jgi:PAS domain S-box-containing protein